MYILIRIILGCIFLVCSVVIIHKTKLHHKKLLNIIFTALSVVLISVLAFVPFENIFITFDSPEAVYEYFHGKKINSCTIIEGEYSDCVIDHKGSSSTLYITTKSSSGWKISSGTNTKKITSKLSDGIKINVYQYKNTSDFYISVLNTHGGYCEISDNLKSDFLHLENFNNSLQETFVTYYTHIREFDSKYYLIINGKQIFI